MIQVKSKYRFHKNGISDVNFPVKMLENKDGI